MRIAIVDDVKNERTTLLNFFKKYPFDKKYCPTEIEEFSSGEEFLNNLQAEKYYLIFLDIYMGEMNGIETARKIREVDNTVKIVFSTSSNDFATESYAVRADYYLLKPYQDEDILKMIDGLNLCDAEAAGEIITPDGQHVVKLRNIIYTSLYGHYVSIHQIDGKVIKVRATHAVVEKLFEGYNDFLTCNRGIIINLNQVYDIDTNKFIMKDGTHIPITVRKFARIKKVYSDFLIEKVRKAK